MQPVGRSASVTCPTVMPATAVSVRLSVAWRRRDRRSSAAGGERRKRGRRPHSASRQFTRIRNRGPAAACRVRAMRGARPGASGRRGARRCSWPARASCGSSRPRRGRCARRTIPRRRLPQVHAREAATMTVMWRPSKTPRQLSRIASHPRSATPPGCTHSAQSAGNQSRPSRTDRDRRARDRRCHWRPRRPAVRESRGNRITRKGRRPTLKAAPSPSRRCSSRGSREACHRARRKGWSGVSTPAPGTGRCGSSRRCRRRRR